MTNDDDFDYDELMKEEDDIEKEKEKLERYKKYVEREQKRVETEKAEYYDERRDKTAIQHEMTRRLRMTHPELADLLDQLWDEKDPAERDSLKEKIINVVPPELKSFFESFF